MPLSGRLPVTYRWLIGGLSVLGRGYPGTDATDVTLGLGRRWADVIPHHLMAVGTDSQGLLELKSGQFGGASRQM